MTPSLPLGHQPSDAGEAAVHAADEGFVWSAVVAFVVEALSLTVSMATRWGTAPSAFGTLGVFAGIVLGLFARAHTKGRPGRGWATAAVVLGGIALGLYVLASMALQGLSTDLEMLGIT